MQNIDLLRYAGVLVPLFSLRSYEGLGVGEFLDLILLVDWAKKAGIRLIQLLPVYDTTINKSWLDSYCYSPLSMFALHPLYLRIEEAFSCIPDDAIKEISFQKERFGKLDQLDYEEVYKLKFKMYKKLFSEEDKKVFLTEEWLNFFQSNCDWLKPYAAFSVLRDYFKKSDYKSWKGWSEGTKEVVDQVCDSTSFFYEEVSLYYFLQFQLHKQFLKASQYAKSKGVSFKGDFPVGVHRWSAEIWANPFLFDLSKNVGAPPDYFNLVGQNWQLPAYNWERMKKENYRWFTKRLEHMQQYYQLVRIDHIFGYFRFWEIPITCSKGALGHFCPSLSLSIQDLPVEMQEDICRYTTPFITEEILDKLFGERKEWIKRNLLEKGEKDRYHFQKTYAKEESFEELKTLSFEERASLDQLFQNVLLIEENGSLYPRIGLERTLSFAYLSTNQQEIAKRWYEVYGSSEEDKLWEETALERLRLFKAATSMEICAEDLGMAPRCTKKVLDELGFLCLYIQRLPKKEGQEFSDPSEYEYASVCSPSNHDTAPLRLWWKENREQAEKFYKDVLKEKGAFPEELSEALCAKIIKMDLNSASKWAVFLLQDLLAMSPKLRSKEIEKERINDPAIYPFYWRWRLHIHLEDLLEQESFAFFIKNLISQSGRSV